MPEITEKMENFIKMTKHLTKLKETLIIIKLISLQKTLRIKFSVASGFLNELYGKIQKPRNAGNQQKAFWIKKHPVLMLYHYKTARNQSVSYLRTIFAKLISSFNSKCSLITLSSTFRVLSWTPKILRKVLKIR